MKLLVPRDRFLCALEWHRWRCQPVDFLRQNLLIIPRLNAWGRAMGDVAYYLRREQEERELAAAASDPQIRAIHEILAQKYAELARREMPPPSESTSQRLST